MDLGLNLKFQLVGHSLQDCVIEFGVRLKHFQFGQQCGGPGRPRYMTTQISSHGKMSHHM